MRGAGGAVLHGAAAAAPAHREEQRFGSPSDYTGTDMFISLVEPAGVDDDDARRRAERARACSNRHLTEQLPVGEGGADFRLLDDATLDVVCVAGPTPPREPVVAPAAQPQRDRLSPAP